MKAKNTTRKTTKAPMKTSKYTAVSLVWNNWIRISTQSVWTDQLRVKSSITFKVDGERLTMQNSKGLIVFSVDTYRGRRCLNILILEEYLSLFQENGNIMDYANRSRVGGKFRYQETKRTSGDAITLEGIRAIRVVVASMEGGFPLQKGSIALVIDDEDAYSAEDVSGNVMVSNGVTEDSKIVTHILIVEDHDECYLRKCVRETGRESLSLNNTPPD